MAKNQNINGFLIIAIGQVRNAITVDAASVPFVEANQQASTVVGGKAPHWQLYPHVNSYL
jgi:hypothetical protein